MTMNTWSFCTRLWAWVRLAADDASSTYSTSILRPFTPPAAFWRPMRALQPTSELPDVDAAAPVFDVMNPIFTELSVTPWSDPAGAAPARPPVLARPSTTTRIPNPTHARAPVRCDSILDPPDRRRVPVPVDARCQGPRS